MVEIDQESGEIIERRSVDMEVIEQANLLAELNEASSVFEYLVARVDEFEKNLGEDEEIGLKLANFGEAAKLHIRSMSYKNPNLIEFHGVGADGLNVTIIQHVSQLNFMLIAMKPIAEEKPYRIGFKIRRDEEEKPV